MTVLFGGPVLGRGLSEYTLELPGVMVEAIELAVEVPGYELWAITLRYKLTNTPPVGRSRVAETFASGVCYAWGAIGHPAASWANGRGHLALQAESGGAVVTSFVSQGRQLPEASDDDGAAICAGRELPRIRVEPLEVVYDVPHFAPQILDCW